MIKAVVVVDVVVVTVLVVVVALVSCMVVGDSGPESVGRLVVVVEARRRGFCVLPGHWEPGP